MAGSEGIMSDDDWWDHAEESQREMEEIAKAEQAESDAATALAEQEALQFAEAQAEAQVEEDFFRKKTARYTITEEPFDLTGLRKVLNRQDENLGPEHGDLSREFAPGGRLRFEVLKAQILDMERNLFEKKRLLESIRMPMHHGRIIIPAPSPYRCNTCGNTGCLHLEMAGIESVIIRNQTTMNGCLAWLPPVVPV
jgi:hypothetical protein